MKITKFYVPTVFEDGTITLINLFDENDIIIDGHYGNVNIASFLAISVAANKNNMSIKAYKAFCNELLDGRTYFLKAA